MARKTILWLGALAFLALPAKASSVSQGDIIQVSLSQLKPTQPSVGYDQIMYKLGRYQFDQKKMFDEICEANSQKGVEYIKKNANPNLHSTFSCELGIGERKKDMKTVVIAPNGEYYLTDGHHTFNAFYTMPKGGAAFKVKVLVAKDYRNLNDMDAFWSQMQKDGNTWLFDKDNQAINHNKLPTSLGLNHFDNDRERSLMYFSRGVSWNKPKQPVPFLEFYWSKELRKNIDVTTFDLNSKQGYADAVKTVSDYMLRYKTTSTGNGLSDDLATILAPTLKSGRVYARSQCPAITIIRPSQHKARCSDIVNLVT